LGGGVNWFLTVVKNDARAIAAVSSSHQLWLGKNVLKELGSRATQRFGSEACPTSTVLRCFYPLKFGTINIMLMRTF
jgi:hypothetical protein